jgi:flagellar biosynthesis/type III secretory pathway chaperone
MTTPAIREAQSPLEAVLLDIDATLADLLVTAGTQYAAVVADDRGRLEAVTRLQKRLSARLGHAEHQRLELLCGRSLAEALAELPADLAEHLGGVSQSIGQTVRELQPLHARNANLLERSAELAGETVAFLQHLLSPGSPAYGAHGRPAEQHSMLVDSRA